MGTFKQSIARIGSLLLVVDAWDDPAPLKRAWYGVAARVSVCVRVRAADALHLRRCVLELHATAVKKTEQGGDFAVAMTALEKQRFLTESATMMARTTTCWGG
jgi:hypothetical protein